MKNTIKYLLIAFLAFCMTGAVIGEWNGTFKVVVKEGSDNCHAPTWYGSVRCLQSTLEWESQTWVGYQTYTFSMGAEDNGWAKGTVALFDYSDPQQECVKTVQETWTSPPNPMVVTIEVIPEIL